MNLNQAQLEAVIKSVKELLAELKVDYPELRLYPVFARFGPRSGQCGLTTDPMIILEEFPDMLIVSPEVEQLGRLLRQYRKAQKLNLSSAMEIKKDLDAAMIKCRAPHITAFYCGDVNIEFRTGILKYEPLQRLQNDPRLPPWLNKVGNIRVIAGSLEYLTHARSET